MQCGLQEEGEYLVQVQQQPQNMLSMQCGNPYSKKRGNIQYKYNSNPKICLVCNVASKKRGNIQYKYNSNPKICLVCNASKKRGNIQYKYNSNPKICLVCNVASKKRYLVLQEEEAIFSTSTIATPKYAQYAMYKYNSNTKILQEEGEYLVQVQQQPKICLVCNVASNAQYAMWPPRGGIFSTSTRKEEYLVQVQQQPQNMLSMQCGLQEEGNIQYKYNSNPKICLVCNVASKKRVQEYLYVQVQIATPKYAQYAMWPPRRGGIFSTSTIATPKYAQYAMWPPRRGGIFSTSTIATQNMLSMQCGLQEEENIQYKYNSNPKYAQYAMWPPRRGEYLVQVQQQPKICLVCNVASKKRGIFSTSTIATPKYAQCASLQEEGNIQYKYNSNPKICLVCNVASKKRGNIQYKYNSNPKICLVCNVASKKRGIFSTSTIATLKYAQYAMYPPRRGGIFIQV